MSDKQHKPSHRSRPTSEAFRAFMAKGWAPRPEPRQEQAAVAPYAAARREIVSQAFPGERLVIPAGGLKVRSNDTDYLFRPHSAFAHLTGLGADREPDAVLVLEPRESGGHEAILFFRPLAGRDTEEFFADSRMGEFWVGARPTLEDARNELGLTTRDLEEFPDALAKDVGQIGIRVVRDADRDVAAMVANVRQQAGVEAESETVVEADAALARHLSTQRLCKDEWEVDQMRQAVDSTHTAFEAVIDQLEEASRKPRGERWIEGVFGLYARHEGNGVGYDSICAAADHANTLHWTRNTGEVNPGDLVLIDAGVEVDSLYTADITRTLPVDGTYTDAQREVYDAVYEAQQAGIAACRPGNKFSDVHAAAIRVIAQYLYDWGCLPEGVTVDDTLDPQAQFHRRWMVHGTSHHLGIDVHDCALALREDYMDAELKPGMILTVEPGLYFKADDLLAPERFRGIGVRIEDDIVITQDGHENLSADMPSSSADVEAWMARVRSGQRRG